jgi:hypothetical protein
MKHPFTPRATHVIVVWACASLVAGAAAAADDAPAVTPYRPSVSTPAALSAPGWLEVEAGVQRSRADDPLRRSNLPYALKLAFTPDWGIRIGGDALVVQRAADGTGLRGGGDTSLVLKRRWAVDEVSAFGLELGANLPTARNGLGSGHADVGLNGIYSRDFADVWHTDLNLLATRLGGADPGADRWQQGWAASLSRSLSPAWSLSGELSGTHRTGQGRTAMALFAASWSASPALALDFGASKGLNAASGGWSVFTGVTFLAGRLF